MNRKQKPGGDIRLETQTRNLQQEPKMIIHMRGCICAYANIYMCAYRYVTEWYFTL